MGEVDESSPAVPLPYPWRDLRLWAAPLFAAGLAAVANAAWLAFAPGRAVSTALIAAAAALVAAAGVAVAVHPRAAVWTAEGNVVPSVLPVIVAAAVAPPVAGPGFWAFAWSACLLLYVWSRTRGIVRSIVRLCVALPEDGSGGRGESAPPPPRGLARIRQARAAVASAGARPLGELAGAATLDGLLAVGLWTALCDAGAGAGAGVAGGAAVHVLGAAAACGGALALAAWAGRADVLRRAQAEEAGVQHGFSRLWWWAVAPAAALCLAVGAAVPTYRAPLQGGAVSRLVMGFLGHMTTRAAAAALPANPAMVRAQNQTGLVLAAVCAAVLVLGWPARRVVQRVMGGMYTEEPSAEDPIRFGERLRLWWARLSARWAGLMGRDRRPVPRYGTWRPLGAAPAGGGRHGPAVPEVLRASRGDIRGRVRAAYGNVLRQAGAAGFGRDAAQTPRGFLAWIAPRAKPARFPLESLTGAYEEARFSTHAVTEGDADRAEGDARAAGYGLALAQAEQRRRAGQPEADPALKWTAPRGVRGMRREY